MRKSLRAAGIVDVEGILETDPAKLAKILGDQATADKVIALAKRLLASVKPAPTPVTPVTPIPPITKPVQAPTPTPKVTPKKSNKRK